MAANTVSLAPERIAAVLGVPPQDVEGALVDVGVDGDYLARALLDGDPQGVLPAVAARLDLPKADLVIALVKAIVREGDVNERVTQLLDAALYQLADMEALRVRAGLVREVRPDAAQPGARSADEDEVLQALLLERLPRVLRRTATAAAVAGATFTAFGALGLLAPHLFRLALVYIAAGAFAFGGAMLLYMALRIYHGTTGGGNPAKPLPEGA